MPTLRERKAEKTRVAIHKAAMRLFAERGYAATTVADIAEAADVSRATFFSYYPSKDDVVFGAAPAAIAALTASLEVSLSDAGVLAAVREWLSSLAGWLDDEDLPLQLRLQREVPAVAVRRLVLGRQLEDLLAGHLERELRGDAPQTAARLAAASIVTALDVIERSVAERIRSEGRPPRPDELAAILDRAMAFVAGGLRELGFNQPAGEASPPRDASAARVQEPRA